MWPGPDSVRGEIPTGPRQTRGGSTKHQDERGLPDVALAETHRRLLARECFLREVIATRAVNAEFRRVLQQVGLTGLEFQLLEFLYAARRATLRQAVRRVQTSEQQLSAAIESLEARSAVVMSRRKTTVQVGITIQGLALAETAVGARDNLIERAYSGLATEDLDRLGVLVRLVGDGVHRMLSEARRP